MNRIPQSLRETIARNIKACRMKDFPRRGGSQLCAKAFGVCAQQWSQWEQGRRTPNEQHMLEIAHFFKTTVEDLRRDKRIPPGLESHYKYLFDDDETDEDDSPTVSSMRARLSSNPHAAPLANPAPAGSDAGYYWLFRAFFQSMESKGIHVDVKHHFDKESLKYLAECLKAQPPDPKE